MTGDILSGVVEWQGLGVVNPFSDEGGLVDLDEYPKLRYYLEARRDVIAKRHVAMKAPQNWYRTIDRIYPTLTHRPKLLIPDIKGKSTRSLGGGKNVCTEIARFQHGNTSSRNTYRSSFIPGLHDICMVFGRA